MRFLKKKYTFLGSIVSELWLSDKEIQVSFQNTFSYTVCKCRLCTMGAHVWQSENNLASCTMCKCRCVHNKVTCVESEDSFVCGLCPPTCLRWRSPIVHLCVPCQLVQGSGGCSVSTSHFATGLQSCATTSNFMWVLGI